MNLSSFSRFSRLLLGLTLAATLALRAADTPPDNSRLVIARGMIVDAANEGKSEPATLRNLTEQIMRRYSDVTVNIIGVDDVVVGDLTLRWPRRRLDAGSEDVVAALLQAFVESMETPAFSVGRPSKSQFLLSRLHHWEKSTAPRRIEVFNLKAYLEGRVDKADAEMQVRQIELRLQTLTANYERIASQVAQGGRAPSEQTEIKNDVALAKEQLSLAVQRMRRAAPSKEETTKRLDRLMQVVSNTLAAFDKKEKMPEFEYHAGTYLLVVIGSDTAIDVTRKVVTALEKSSD